MARRGKSDQERFEEKKEEEEEEEVEEEGKEEGEEEEARYDTFSISGVCGSSKAKSVFSKIPSVALPTLSHRLLCSDEALCLRVKPQMYEVT